MGITTIFIFVSLGWGLFDYVQELKESSAANIVTVVPKGVGAPGLDNTFYLTEKDIETVKSAPSVIEAMGVYTKVAQITKGKMKKFVFAFAYDHDKPLIEKIYNVNLIEGRKLKNEDIGKVVLGYNYKIEGKVFNRKLRLNQQIEINEKKARIVGFFNQIGNPQDDSNIYLSNDFFEEIYPDNSGKYNQIIAEADITSIDSAIKNIESRLRSSRNLKHGKEDFFVTSFQDLIEQYTSAIDYIVYFVVFIALISVFVSAINTANTTITSVLERVREIGIMKAIGAKNKDIFNIFVFESGFLGFVAGILGILFGFIITEITGIFLENQGWGFLKPHYSWYLFVECVLFASLTGAISGIIPAWKASKVRPVKSLRYE